MQRTRGSRPAISALHAAHQENRGSVAGLRPEADGGRLLVAGDPPFAGPDRGEP
ncbi:hypothetical protein [Streptomyces sp. NPDC089799]|uniref:hypothetical protein n=1 Tax=Streptomyces sp. NPDC089799 TaxID=3155066 RepID=UPI00341E80C7